MSYFHKSGHNYLDVTQIFNRSHVYKNMAFGKQVNLGSGESCSDSDDTRGETSLVPQAISMQEISFSRSQRQLCMGPVLSCLGS